MKFRIRYGLGGGFGGAGEWEEIEADSLEAADHEAYLLAVEVYESYEGLHGLRTVEEIMDEEDLPYEEAVQEYHDEMESWLEYEAEELK